MSSPRLAALGLVLAAYWLQDGHAASTTWIGDWREDMDFQCDLGAHITFMKSKHWNAKEDRRWAIECTNAGFVTGHCKWSDYTNVGENWNAKGNAYKSDRGHCKIDGQWGIMTGLKGHWLSEDGGDRRWKMRCCSTNHILEKCKWTGWLNDWDDPMEKELEFGKAIISMDSNFHTTHHDRRYRLQVCDVLECKADTIEIEESVEADEVETAIIGVTTATGCNPDITYYLGLGHEASATDSVHFGKSSSESITWGASVSVSAGFEAKVPFIGGASLSIEQTLETSGEHTKSLEEMKGTETTTGAFAHQVMAFTGPAAALMFATTKKYEYASGGVSAKFTGTCYRYDSDGNVASSKPYEKTGKLSINGDHYGLTHFVTRLSHNYGGSRCGAWDGLRGCVQTLNADNVLNAENLLNNFEKCLTSLGGESVRSLTYTKTENTPYWSLGTPVDHLTSVRNAGLSDIDPTLL